ncbi:MAG: phosphoribosylamine--glycine ligase [Thermoprotei archaeon]|jgi:phosphoribosylamine--glycine ligase
MKIMGVGGGAREHALAEAISKSTYNLKIYWVSEHRNPGIYRIVKQNNGEYAFANIIDAEKIAYLAAKWYVDIVVIGPEEPNFHGVSNEVEKNGIPCIGAKRELSVIEMSKAKMRQLQWYYNIPGKLLFKTYQSYDEALRDLEQYSDTLTWLQNVAIKPARQAGGRGVKVIEDHHAYLRAEKQRFKENHMKWLESYISKYDDIKERILIEEKVWGPEYTLQCFVDGYTIIGMPLVQDNKHAYDFDIGPETGGMGSYTGHGYLLPFITQEEYQRSLEIVKSMVNIIQKITGEKYRGFIAGQMMLTEIEGPTLIEMYSRLGDPEGINVLALLETDIVEIFKAIVDGHLSKIKIKFSEDATVVKAIAPKGYPDFKNLAENHILQVNEDIIRKMGCKLYWGSVHLQDDNIIKTTGSRMLEILAVSKTPQEASKRIEKCLNIKPINLLDSWGVFHRSDIASEEMITKRAILAERVRSLYKYREERGILGKRSDWLPKKGKIDPVRILLNEIRSGDK